MDGGEPGYDGLRRGALVSAAEVEAARTDFVRAHPHRSAKKAFYLTQLLALALLGAGVVWAFRTAPELSFQAAHHFAFALFAAAIAFRFCAAASLNPILWRLAAPAEWPTYTVLCPVYREANIVTDLLASISRLDYPHHALDVKILAEADDAETLAALRALDLPDHVEVLVLPAANPRTKPKALNVGLARARGAYLVVYDAEDRPHAQQLQAALAAFQHGPTNLACVQAPLSIDNADVNWIARQFAAEYAIQFREILALLSRLKLPLPLGGSSNHFRTETPRAVGGWDPYNVYEDRAKFAKRNAHLRSASFSIPFASQTCASAA